MIHRPGSPTQQVSEWLSRFGAALDRKDRAAAAELFADECYWRDLISFTWNIKTLEGKDEIQAMLAATISDVQPGRLADPGRGNRGERRDCGLVHVRDRRRPGKRLPAFESRGMLDAADHDDRTQGIRGKSGADARERHGARGLQESEDVAGAKDSGRGGTGLRNSTLLRHHRRRTGRHRTGGEAETPGSADAHHREEPSPRRFVAESLQVALPARPRVVRPPSLPAVPRPLARVLAEGQDRRLAGDVRQGHGVELLALHPLSRRPIS